MEYWTLNPDFNQPSRKIRLHTELMETHPAFRGRFASERKAKEAAKAIIMTHGIYVEIEKIEENG